MITNIPAEANGLGTPVAEYTPRHGTGRLILSLITGILFSVLVVAMGLFLIVGAFQWSSGANRYFFVAIGLMVVLIGVWLSVRAIRKRSLGKRVLVFSEGLAYTQQGKTDIIRWDDVAAVWRDVTHHYYRQPWQTTHRYTGTAHVYTIQLNDGRKYTFGDALGNVEELGGTIQQESLHHILPRLRQAYEAGQTVPFGALGISRAGISRGYNMLPWDQVRKVEIYEGFLNVYSTKEQTITDLILSKGKGAWASVAVAKMPNAFVFKAMVDEIIGATSKFTTD